MRCPAGLTEGVRAWTAPGWVGAGDPPRPHSEGELVVADWQVWKGLRRVTAMDKCVKSKLVHLLTGPLEV